MEKHIKQIITEEIDDYDKILNQNGTINFNSFEIKDKLNPDIFNSDNKLKTNIREDLLNIFHSIIDESFLIDINDVEDVIIVGSIVSYHYSSYSDIDFHIIVNMKGLNSNEELVKKFLDDERRIWNIEHHIEIEGYDVEIYFQDKQEINTSNGCYSVLNNKWVKFPSKEDYTIDKTLLSTKAISLIEKIDDICDSEYHDINYVQNLYDKIINGRKEDLKENGEFSEGNILFKILRRTGHLEKLKTALLNIKDSELSESDTCPTISKSMETALRNYIIINHMSNNDNYKDIINNVFGESAWDMFTPDEQTTLISIIQSELSKDNPDYIKNIMYESMRININDFNNALLESVKVYCKENNTKTISKKTLIRLIENQFIEENNEIADVEESNDEYDCIARDEQELSELLPPYYNQAMADAQGLHIIVAAEYGESTKDLYNDLNTKIQEYANEHDIRIYMIAGRKNIAYKGGFVTQIAYFAKSDQDIFINKDKIILFNNLYNEIRK